MCFYVVIGHIPETIAKAFGVTRLLALAKPSNDIQPIVISEVFYRLVSRNLCF
jgi:hypothetical protein